MKNCTFVYISLRSVCSVVAIGETAKGDSKKKQTALTVTDQLLFIRPVIIDFVQPILSLRITTKSSISF